MLRKSFALKCCMVFLAATGILLVPMGADSQENCTETCWDGVWNGTFFTCDQGPATNCSHCDVVCQEPINETP